MNIVLKELNRMLDKEEIHWICLEQVIELFENSIMDKLPDPYIEFDGGSINLVWMGRPRGKIN